MLITIFIFIFIAFLVLGIIATAVQKARGRVKSSADHRQAEASADRYQQLIDTYNKGGSSLVSETDYLMASYMMSSPVGGYDPRKAASFAVTCDARSIREDDAESMKKIMRESGLYGDPDAEGFDVLDFFRTGKRINAAVSSAREN